ncbi:MAG: peptidoglycan DD-metalloendopeptidase family protein, partial [Burkholderiales bacterium]|nr:peptidoglycan DD-metalloendopeptidase family protein [Burkholderiales bacterium]
LAADLKKAQTELEGLQRQITRQQQTLSVRRDELSDQLRRQYSSGLSPWSALLSGDDPQELGRNLAYLDYVSKARADTVAALKKDIDRLAQLEAQADVRQKDVARLVSETTQQKEALEAQKKERATVLARIEGQMQAQRAEATRLGEDEKRLAGLISDLDGQLKAAQQAAAEAERRAQEARKLELARKEQAQRAAEADKRRQAAEQAAEQAAQAGRTTQAESDTTSLAAGKGLPKSVRWPIRGTVMARFGTDRPEGGIWRGILVRADAGAAVQVVGAGTVVYSNWLRGFGNLLIVDHGQEYLSVYAYNQSLLKQVGDTVRAGETVALAGSTGGQVDSALYFEIRHRGVAVDPIAYLAR